jgi:hypothetical protein
VRSSPVCRRKPALRSLHSFAVFIIHST